MSNVLNILQEIPEFEPVPTEQLQWLIDKSEIVNYAEGDYIFKKGDPVDNLIIVLKGGYSIRFGQNGQFKEMGQATQGGITGVLPYSRAKTATGFAVALTDSTILVHHKKNFPEMIRENHKLVEVFVHNMTSRVRAVAHFEQQNEKMVALGKLSAGLAHELNNPASAVVRSSTELKKHLQTGPEKFKTIMSMQLTATQIDAVTKFVFSRVSQGIQSLSLMEKTEMEDELADWLEDYGVEDGYLIAETLADFGFEVSDLEDVLESVGEDSFPSVIGWVDNTLNTEKFVSEIQEASERISKLVSSIKSYSHMDRSQDKQPADIHIGLRNTVTMLNHKLKAKKITIKEEFQKDLPHPPVFVSELNQVWTNLIDNAIDALEHEGEITLNSSANKEMVTIEVTDNGQGIPEDVMPNIFDPFYTTKAVGEGTGLGLDAVQRIINQHGGTINVNSVKGKTTFKVCLPIES